MPQCSDEEIRVFVEIQREMLGIIKLLVEKLPEDG